MRLNLNSRALLLLFLLSNGFFFIQMHPGILMFSLINCRKDRAKGVDILVNDLKVFAAFNEDLFKEITQLLTLENFRCEQTFHGKLFC